MKRRFNDARLQVRMRLRCSALRPGSRTGWRLCRGHRAAGLPRSIAQAWEIVRSAPATGMPTTI